MDATFIRGRTLSERESDLVWKSSSARMPLVLTGTMADAALSLEMKGYGTVFQHKKHAFITFQLNEKGMEISPKF